MRELAGAIDRAVQIQITTTEVERRAGVNRRVFPLENLWEEPTC